MKKKLKKVCAWCQGSKEKTDKLIKEGFEVTHGICKACAKNWK